MTLDFKKRKRYKLSKVNFSNKRTITGRIQARDDYNPQNLRKDNSDRENIISRFIGGKIFVFDYVSFEARIALQLIDDENYKKFYLERDLHHETAKVLFGEIVTSEQRSFSKNINNALLYGSSEENLFEKLSEFFTNPEEKLYHVKILLKPIIDKANEIKISHNAQGYLQSPWGYIVRAEKKHASFNNYMQMYASEIIINKTIELKKLLSGLKSQYLFQVHDSIVFDISPDEQFLISEIKQILSHVNEMTFTVDCSTGLNYKEQEKLLTF
jgi:DNA polymerase I-like protein with 3'-5' exonuclease and polymerase domains